MYRKSWAAGAAALLGAALALGQPVLAQAGGNGARQGQHQGMGQLKKLADYLGLTSDQRAQIKTIMQNTAQQVRAVRSDTSLTPDQKTAKIKDIRKDSRKQIMAILKPEQKAKLKQLRQQQRATGGK